VRGLTPPRMVARREGFGPRPLRAVPRDRSAHAGLADRFARDVHGASSDRFLQRSVRGEQLAGDAPHPRLVGLLRWPQLAFVHDLDALLARRTPQTMTP